MEFSLTSLGIGSAVPSNKRHSSAHVVSIHGRLILLDCGESTQLQLRRYKFNISKISIICISHLHGDHFFGLPGLISTMQMLGKTSSLKIIGPSTLLTILESVFQSSITDFSFPIDFCSLEENDQHEVEKNSEFSISAFPLKHSLPCFGFLITEIKRKTRIRKDFILEYSPDIPSIKAIKDGADYIDNRGIIHSNSSITIAPPKPKSLAYCCDTAYNESLVEFIYGCDLLIHESTFTSEKEKAAEAKMHSTAAQAARIASLAKAQKLLLTHFGGEYKDVSNFLSESLPYFANTHLAIEGESIDI